MIAPSTFTCSARLLLVVSLPVVGPGALTAQSAGVRIALSSATTAGGNVVSGTLTLPQVAPTGGFAVTLSSKTPAVALFTAPGGAPPFASPVVVTVAAGKTEATFQVRTFGVLAQTSVVLNAASAAGVAATSLTVTPPVIRTLTITPQPVVGGQPATVSINIDGRAPQATGLLVNLTSTSTALPASATMVIPVDASSQTVAISTTQVAAFTNASLTAALATTPAATALAAVGIAPLSPKAVQLNPTTIFGGSSSTGTVILNSVAPAGGLVVQLRSSSSDATIPASVTVPAGSDRQTFSITTRAVSALESVSIGALGPSTSPTQPTTTIADGSSNTIVVGEAPRVSAALSLAPLPVLQSIAPLLTPVTGGDTITLRLSVSQVTGSTGVLPIASAQLATDHPELVRLPSSVPLVSNTLSATSIVATFVASTVAPTADQNVSITATLGASSVSTSVLVKKPIFPLASLSIKPSSVTGGGDVKAHLQWASDFTGQTLVTLSSDHPELVQLPAASTLQASQSPTQLTIHTSHPAVSTVVTITAVAGRQRISSTLTINP